MISDRFLLIFLLLVALQLLLNLGADAKASSREVEVDTGIDGNTFGDIREGTSEENDSGLFEDEDEDEEGEDEEGYGEEADDVYGGDNDDYDDEEDEEDANPRGGTGGGGFMADFYNDLKGEVISLYWKNAGNGDEVWLADIEPKSKSTIKTFPNHVFIGIADESKVTPEQHTMRAGVRSYRFAKRGGNSNGRSSSSSTSSGSNSASHTDSSADAAAHIGGGAKTTRGGFKKYVKYIDEKSTSVSAKFKCMCKEIDLWFDQVIDSNYQGSLSLGQEMTINTYEGHVFLFTPKGNKDKILARHIMSDDSPVYEITDPDFKIPQKLLDETNAEKEFKVDYFKKNGIKWRHYYGPEGPRAPPILHMWPAEYEGQTHKVNSLNGYWTCAGKSKDCKSQNPVDLTIEVMSLAPKAYLIENFLSMAEADEIIRIAKLQVGESLVGNVDAGGARKSSTRTSRNAWVKRDSSDIIKSIYLRAADVLNISETILDSSKNAEDMQVVYYKNGQKYDAHHDWGVSGYPESRYITLLMYLTDQADPKSGGETAFPKGADGRGFKIHPGKGSAVLFYNIMADGNADDLALHAALPVHRGEKWLANFWVWDPKRK